MAACLAALALAAEGRGDQSAPPRADPAPPQGVPEAAFATREIKTAVEPGVAETTLTYDFHNNGDLPMAVERFSQNCGCMVGAWDGVPVETGASGKITAKFLTNGLRGTVRKSLHVKFVGYGTVELVAEVTIPEAVTYSAQTLRWPLGSAPRAQRIDIVVHRKDPLRVLSVSGGGPAFACTLETLREGQHYRLTVTPADTATEQVCVLQVRTDAKDPRDALTGLFALVEKSAPPPPPPPPQPPQPTSPVKGGPS